MVVLSIGGMDADLSGANLTRAELFRAMSTNDGGHYQAIHRSVRGGRPDGYVKIRKYKTKLLGILQL